MRSYLLGQLSDEQATALEEAYFSNRDFFLKLQSEETALIGDYLDGKLLSADKQYFENRYLQVPLLKRKVEDVRRQRKDLKAAPQSSVWASWRVAFALASVLILGVGIWTYHIHKTRLPQTIAGGVQPQVHSVVAVRLSPGQTKGQGSETVQFVAPESGSSVNLVLELPGQFSPARCQVRIFFVDSDRRWIPVWNSSELLVSSRDGNGQVLTLQIGGTLLRPGDYVLEALRPDGEVRETYLYRIIVRDLSVIPSPSPVN